MQPCLPVGLARYKHEALVQEAMQRGINPAGRTKRYAVNTREHIIAGIKAYETAKAHPSAVDAFDQLMEKAADDVQTGERARRGVTSPWPYRFKTVSGPEASAAASQGASGESSQRQAPRGQDDTEITDLLTQIRANQAVRDLLKRESALVAQ